MTFGNVYNMCIYLSHHLNICKVDIKYMITKIKNQGVGDFLSSSLLCVSGRNKN